MKRSYTVFAVAIVLALVLVPSAYYLTQGRTEGTGTGDGISIVDSAGRTVSVPANLTRIAVVNGYAAEVMRALGVDLSIIVGVSGDMNNDTTLWPEFSDVPVVQTTPVSEPDIEGMLDLRIQALFTYGTHQFINVGTLEKSLSPAGVVVVGLDFFRYENLYAEIGLMGKIFGKEERAAEIVADMQGVEDLIADRIGSIPEEDRPTVVVEHHGSSAGDPVVLSSLSQWTALIANAGGHNVYDDQPGTTIHVTAEDIITQRPDYYFIDGMRLDIGYGKTNQQQYESTLASLSQRPGFTAIPAIQNANVYIFSGEFSGPMMIYGTGVLAALLYPDLFSDMEAVDFIEQYYELFHDRGVQGTLFYPGN